MSCCKPECFTSLAMTGTYPPFSRSQIPFGNVISLEILFPFLRWSVLCIPALDQDCVVDLHGCNIIFRERQSMDDELAYLSRRSEVQLRLQLRYEIQCRNEPSRNSRAANQIASLRSQ